MQKEREKHMSFKLGSKLRDMATGFTGIAVARIEYISGCIQYCILPSVKEDGKYVDGVYIDEQRLEFVGDGLMIQTRPTGGPSSIGEAPPIR